MPIQPEHRFPKEPIIRKAKALRERFDLDIEETALVTYYCCYRSVKDGTTKQELLKSVSETGFIRAKDGDLAAIQKIVREAFGVHPYGVVGVPEFRFFKS